MRHQELNLLIIFDAIMTEGSITRAADKLELTQPAVSNALSRMRTAWNDELFLKDGRNIQPTIYSQNLWKQIRTPLSQLEDAVDPSTFNPATDQRTFRLVATDAIINIAWPALREILETKAPNINIHAIPYTDHQASEKSLNDARADLVIGPITTTGKDIHSEFLFNPCFICVMRPGHPLAKAQMSLKDFADAEHLLVSFSGTPSGYTDQILAQHGLTRRISMTVNHFSAVPQLLKNSNLISVVPSTTVADAIFSDELVFIDPPVKITAKHVGNFWHQRQDRDEGLLWLKEHLNRIIKEHVETHYIEIRKCNNKN